VLTTNDHEEVTPAAPVAASLIVQVVLAERRRLGGGHECQGLQEEEGRHEDYGHEAKRRPAGAKDGSTISAAAAET